MCSDNSSLRNLEIYFLTMNRFYEKTLFFYLLTNIIDIKVRNKKLRSVTEIPTKYVPLYGSNGLNGNPIVSITDVSALGPLYNW